MSDPLKTTILMSAVGHNKLIFYVKTLQVNEIYIFLRIDITVCLTSGLLIFLPLDLLM